MKKGLIISIAIIALLGVAVGVYAIGAGSNKDEPNNHRQEKTVKTKPEKTIYNVGEEVEYATVTMKVNSFSTESTVHDFIDAYPAPEGTKYLVVNQTVTNTTKQPFKFPPFWLLTEDGAYIEPSNENYAYVGENALLRKTLNPGVPTTGDMAYLISEDTETITIGGNYGDTSKFLGVKLEL